MRTTVISLAFAAAIAAPLLAPGTASASCSERKTTGAVLGGVGGALIGNSIARGGGGLILGGLGGALLGHEIAGAGCRHARVAYAAPPPPDAYGATAGPPVYYDQYGHVVEIKPPAQGPAPIQVAYSGACRAEQRRFYDQNGALVNETVQTCPR